MGTDQVTRKLSAILAADVVGYSRLTREDEEGVLAAVKAILETIIEPKIAEHRGRIFKLIGDGILAEFGSVVDAVRSAIELQQALANHQNDAPEDSRIVFRMGINLGDVIVDGNDIQGDGVNVAARLEGLADPGGICISDNVHEEVRDRIPETFSDAGEQAVKNIDRPLRVWRWSARPRVVQEVRSNAVDPFSSPGRPSIAVLPFENMSSDPDQRFLADGIVEDVITELSRFRWLLVIARNSTFAYRDSSKDVREIASELGVRYVVEGSVRRAGDRLRLTAQLVEGGTGTHLWAERFDRHIDDVFALQDELTASVVGRVAPSLRSEEIRRVGTAATPDLGAWQRHVRGLSHFYRFQREENALAIADFEAALAADATFHLPRALLSKALFTKVWLGWSESPDEDISRAAVEAHAVVAEATDLAEGHYALACVEFWNGRLEAALRAIERCMDLNPNFADGYLVQSQVLSCLGRFEEAERLARHALTLNPVDPLRWVYLGNLADALYGQERWAEALAAANDACDGEPGYAWGTLICAAALSQLGQKTEARQKLDTLRVLDDRSPEAMVEGYPFADQADRKRLIDAVKRL